MERKKGQSFLYQNHKKYILDARLYFLDFDTCK